MNMEENKIILYPYDYNNSVILRYYDLFKYKGTFVPVSPKGTGLIGKDASIVDKGDKLNCIVKSFDDKNEFLDKENLCILLESDYTCDLEQDLSSSDFKCVIDCIEKERELPLEVIPEDDHQIFKFETPVIFVTGLNERTNKKFIQLELQRYFSKEYTVSLILSSGKAELFGDHSYPQFMFSKDISEAAKIILFNRYVKKIEQDEKPDIIVIGIPGSVFPYNFEVNNYFGI